MKRIVIAGAGFVGLRTARLLAGRLRDTEIFLIDPKERFLFTPWLVDALAEEKTIAEITKSLAQIAEQEGFTYVRGRVAHVDREKCLVDIQTTSGPDRSLGYDCLLLCQGAQTSYYGIPGAAEYSLPLKVEEDVAHIHEAVRKLAEKGGGDVALIGGGPTGVEAAFALKSFANSKDINLKLLQAAPQILPGFTDGVVKRALREFKKRDIEVMVGDPVTAVEPGKISTASGASIRADIVVWCAGIQANTVPVEPAVETEKGYYIVDNHMRVDHRVFSAGDVSNFKLHGVPIPKTAQAAMEMAEVLAGNIERSLTGRRLRPFKTESKGAIITLGKTAVTSLKFKITTASPFWVLVRNILYRYRFRQMTGF